MNEPYLIVTKGAEAETELKKSRFIAHVSPANSVDEAVDFVTSIKKEFYDARHNCYAYVLGKDGDVVKYSDDGEPAQTAGLPIYNVIKEMKIRNVCVVVTRYFGGTLLGAGPLSRMYVEAAKLGLEASEKGMMRYGIEAKIESDYSDGEKVRRFLEKEGIEVLNTYYTDKVTTVIRMGAEGFENLSKSIISLTASKAEISKISDAYFIDSKI